MTDEKVEVTETEVTQIATEINKVEESKLEAAKQEGKEELKKEMTIDDLEKKLQTAREENDRLQKEQEEVAKRKQLEAELAAEEERKQQAVKRHVVPESKNPTIPQEESKVPERTLTPREEWTAFEQAHRVGQFSASENKNKK